MYQQCVRHGNCRAQHKSLCTIYERHVPVTRVDKVVELTTGDKTITSLATELQTKLQAAMPTTNDFLNSTVTVTKIDDCRLRFTLTGASLVDTGSGMEILTFASLGWVRCPRRGPEQEQMHWTSTTCKMHVRFVDLIRGP